MNKMKLNIEIDLNDFYAENFDGDYESGISATKSLSEEVAGLIKSEVRLSIREQVSKDVERIASDAYAEFGEEKIKTIVDFAMDEFIKNGEVKERYGNEMIPVKDHLRSIFDKGNNWDCPEKKFKEIGQEFAKECRSRYDLSFASSIVTGLEKQGLLKPGVFEALINGTDG